LIATTTVVGRTSVPRALQAEASRDLTYARTANRDSQRILDLGLTCMVLTALALRLRFYSHHTVLIVEATVASPVGARRTARRYDANTITHSASTNTAIPAW
jgi:hypothetical protein